MCKGATDRKGESTGRAAEGAPIDTTIPAFSASKAPIQAASGQADGSEGD